jgi:hypothetical protein
MDKSVFKQIKANEQANKRRLLELNQNLDEKSGIYVFTREDENGFKYAYIGQAKHLLTRLAQHVAGYEQHIDKSIRKYGLYSDSNIYGWKVGTLHFSEDDLNDMERKYIKMYADKGYQLRNKTAGGQDTGKSQIDDYKPNRTYREGVQQGKLALARDLRHIMDKHLTVELKAEKKANKTSQKQFEKFMWLLNEENYREVKENE